MMSVRDKTLAGRYRLEEVIGRGGMSTVYRATDELLGRPVAVKVLLATLVDQDPAYAARFEREARAAAALASSAVVTVFDTGLDEDGGQYIVMEYVRGLSLAQMLADERPLEIPEAMRITERVADALRAAHAAGILHRDIKPANVMIAEDGTVKLLDFGIARRLDGTTLTQAASVVGTAAYMAPERALGQPGDARADIYSLGCLLYAMLTGRPPFTGEISAAVLHQQVNADPAPPSQLRAGIPAALDALVLAMLAKPPEARPQAAAQVRDRLLALSGVPPAVAAAGATAATRRMARAEAPATAATRQLQAAKRLRYVLGAALADHRWRALAMGLATALITLLAVTLLAGGGSAPHPAASTHHAPSVTRRATTTTPKPATTPSTPAPPPPHPHEGPKHGGKDHHKKGPDGGGPGGD
jgi:serine/threonine-protein kinase